MKILCPTKKNLDLRIKNVPSFSWSNIFPSIIEPIFTKKISFENLIEQKKKRTFKFYYKSDLELKKNRRNFLTNFLGTNFLVVLVKKSENFPKNQGLFAFNGTLEEKKKSEKTIVSEFSFQNIKLSDEKLTILQSFVIDLSSILLLFGLVTISTSFSERFSNKKKLPLSYDPNQIFSYFKLRPEKVFFRFSQISFEVFWFFSSFAIDNPFFSEKKLIFSRKKKKGESKENWVYINMDFLRINFLKTYKKPKMKESFQGFRISNIYQANKLKNQKKQEENLEKKWDQKAKKFRRKIVNLSPAFVKIAQAFAARPDIVGERVANELQCLQDDMPFFSNEKAFEFIKTELGVSHSKIFSTISDFPVAAASLGQVYKGQLDDVPVAIKVQRPDLVSLIALDILIIRFFAWSIQKIFQSKTDLVSSVDEYAERLFEELDYRKEASNMIKFRSLYGYMDMIYIPRVFTDYSSQRVLVMDWVQGDRLVKNSVKVSQEDISLIETGVKCSLVQLLEIGFLHCDPHAGNLIKTKDGRLAYLDFGLVSEVPESVRFSFITAILHLINKEFDSLAKDFSGMALIRSDDLDKEINLFSFSLSEIFEKSLSDSEKFTFQDIAEKIFRLSVKFPFILPPYFLNNLRALATLEGLGKVADSNFKIVNIIYPYIINRLLTNRSPQFRNSLEKFLIDKKSSKPNWGKLEALLQDPEWVGNFSDQNQKIPEAFMSFFISPSGSFINQLILREFSKNLWAQKFVKTLIKKVKNFLFLLLSNKKRNFFLKKKTTTGVLLRIFFKAKIYNTKTFILLIIFCARSSFLFFFFLLGQIIRLLRKN